MVSRFNTLFPSVAINHSPPLLESVKGDYVIPEIVYFEV